jgi:hypothetical protein
MYGTIFRFQVKPGKDDEMMRFMESERANAADGKRLRDAGMITSYLCKLDKGGYMGVAIFENKEKYFANASDPAQDAWYRKWRELLVDDPEWNDGEITEA